MSKWKEYVADCNNHIRNNKIINPEQEFVCLRDGIFEDYARDLCSVCETQLIFDDVREYIRSEEVNEYDVAKHFDIPVGMVQQWIKEGRIEYKERGAKTVMSSFCQRCGAKVTFGTLCQKCLKELNP